MHSRSQTISSTKGHHKDIPNQSTKDLSKSMLAFLRKQNVNPNVLIPSKSPLNLMKSDMNVHTSGQQFSSIDNIKDIDCEKTSEIADHQSNQFQKSMEEAIKDKLTMQSCISVDMSSLMETDSSPLPLNNAIKSITTQEIHPIQNLIVESDNVSISSPNPKSNIFCSYDESSSKLLGPSNFSSNIDDVSIQIQDNQVDDLLEKYFNSDSDLYVFKDIQFELKTRASHQEECLFSQSVGAKKLEFVNQFFDKDNELNIDMLRDKDFKFYDQSLLSLFDLTVCQHLSRKHRARFMCHSCYHARGNQKKATKCGHIDKPNHSGGLCKSCYHRQYYFKKIKQQSKASKTKKTDNVKAVPQSF